MAKCERIVHEYFRDNPNLIGEGLDLIGSSFHLTPLPDIKNDKSDLTSVPWDRYGVGDSVVDLIGVHKSHRNLVLCEFKWGGGEGDGALDQLCDYFDWVNINQENQKMIREKARETGIDHIGFEGTEMYLIVAGHVSKLLLHRVKRLRDEYKKHLKVFHALPSNNMHEWRCRVPPAWPA